MSHPPRIGLTGPIGCGKSTIAAWLGELGGRVIDADRLAREVTAESGPALDAIRGRFGDGILRPDGALDRSALAVVVFDDPAALRDLEAIVHPLVRRRIEEAVRVADESGAPFIVLEAIKLVEGGLANSCDGVWLIECSAEAQRQRLRGRGLADADIERRLAAQGANLADRLASAATQRIETDGPPHVVRAGVERLLAELLAR